MGKKGREGVREGVRWRKGEKTPKESEKRKDDGGREKEKEWKEGERGQEIEDWE